jgi:hypothetical protein
MEKTHSDFNRVDVFLQSVKEKRCVCVFRSRQSRKGLKFLFQILMIV